MPKYTYEFHEAYDDDTLLPIELSSDEVALIEGERTATARVGILKDEDRSSWTSTAKDESGREIGKISLGNIFTSVTPKFLD